MISIERAIEKSNNVYFIKLANERHLQEDMVSIYMKCGMFLRGVGGYYFNRPPVNTDQENKWRDLWRKTEFATKPAYDPNNIRRTRAKGISGMSWGQGELIATPAAIARMAGSIANHGTLVPSRYVLRIADSQVPVGDGVKLANDPKYADFIRGYMIKQSAPKVPILGVAVAGKSGTPERIWKGERINDGWYVFFAPKANGTGYIVVCVRIESTKGSSDAVRLAGQHVVPLLLKKGYIKNIGDTQIATTILPVDSLGIQPQVSEPVSNSTEESAPKSGQPVPAKSAKPRANKPSQPAKEPEPEPDTSASGQ